jgi:hypothetical protein
MERACCEGFAPRVINHPSVANRLRHVHKIWAIFFMGQNILKN